MTSFDIYLASASPRREELLNSLGFCIKCCPADIDETPKKDEAPEDYVQRLALEKAISALSCLPNRIINIPFLGADTVVVCEGKLFGKPVDKQHAMQMWQAMSGGEHQVLTAVAIIDGFEENSQQIVELSISQVKFKKLYDVEMEAYWKTGEPHDKAGAYGIQGYAAAWVESIQGSYSGIMGLPLFEVNRALRQFDLNWL